jgi:DNA repair protein RecO (recombination protein O)
MLYTTHAILLKHIPYKDKRMLLSAYTKQMGLHLFVIYKTDKNKRGHLMPLNLLEISYYSKGNNPESRSIVKELRTLYTCLNTYTHIYKSAQLIFINEILDKTLKEHSPDEKLFDFLVNILKALDAESYNPWFHILFLVNYMNYLGIKPDINNLEEATSFQIEQGEVSKNEALHALTGNSLECFKQLLMNKIPENNYTNLKSMLAYIIKYYEFHIPGFKNLKSVEVLTEILV